MHSVLLIQCSDGLVGKTRTVLLPGSVVLKRFALPEDLQRWVTADPKARGELRLHGGVNLGQRDGRGTLTQLLCSLLVLGSQTLAVPTPAEDKQVCFILNH